MPEQLTRSDYEYILSSLKYARYAHEETHYATAELKHQQMACLDHIENKLRTLRDATDDQKASPVCEPEIF
ncbi:MAG: hypothetical protein V3V05_06990 [Pontiella sp.]